ncbi:MAG TPA: T9SS type A sorting domain-containing protein, partial [Firmicutes bacterium]|nr:T9SS type A sorting domain-containing protein [Bacillota bacterium]
YIINSNKSTANLEVTDVYAKNGSSWILDVTMPQKGAAPGESIPVYINVDTLGLVSNVYYDSIVVVSNGIGGKGRADAYMPILLDYNSGQHAGISLVADKKAIKKLNLITKKNPFTDNTAIEFALPNKAKVTLSIYDISGKKVNTLVDREYNSGRYTMKWNGEDSNGKKLPGGFYFARIKAGNKSMITKIVKLR